MANIDGLDYRTGPACGADFIPEPVDINGHLRVAFACTEYGLHTLVDPFEHPPRQTLR